MKAGRKKDQVTYKDRPIRIILDFSKWTLKANKCVADTKGTQMLAQTTISGKKKKGNHKRWRKQGITR